MRRRRWDISHHPLVKYVASSWVVTRVGSLTLMSGQVVAPVHGELLHWNGVFDDCLVVLEIHLQQHIEEQVRNNRLK